MSSAILVRGARQLVTLRGPNCPRRGSDLRNLAIVQDGSVLIVDGIIREVGLTRRLENLAQSRNALEINASGCVVLPGFVDSHTHLVCGPPRLLDYEMSLAGATPEEIAAAGGGFAAIFKAIQETTGHVLETRAARVLGDCIRQGTTTIEAKSGYGVTETAELKILRAHAGLHEQYGNLVSTFMPAIHLTAAYQTATGNYIEWLCNHMLPLARRRKLASFADIVCDEDRFSVAEARRFLVRAKELGFGIKLHAGQYSNVGAVRLGVELGATSVDHAVFIDTADIELLAASPVIATLLPGPQFYLGARRYAPVRNLIDRGAAVALATNYNPETSPSNNMQMILSLACNKMNMTPAEAITSATINGAYALGMGSRVGSLEAGKDADLILLRVPDYREIPYHFGANLVAMTMKKGRILYQASEVKWTTVGS